MEALRAFSLPPGFGFHPTDVELISHYLKGKLLGQKIDLDIIPEIDIYKHEPWDLPARCQVPTRDSKWHFFASRDKKYPNGSRSNRATEAGYWKSTGKDRNIRLKNRIIGTKKTLVFHEGRPPCGKRTDWIMHEYYLNENECKANPDMKDAFVLCRITKRDGWMQDDVNISEHISPQSDNVNSEIIQSENVSNCSNQPNEVASVEEEKPSSPSMSAEELEAWFSELLVPSEPQVNTFSDVKSETEEVLSSLAVVNQEPMDSQFVPGISEDPHLLFQVDEFYDILKSDGQNIHAFGELDSGYMGYFDDQQGDIFADMNNDECALNDYNTWTGIQIREREPKPTCPTLNNKVRLRTSKMESRNGESLSGTIKINQDFHLDPLDEKQPTALDPPDEKQPTTKAKPASVTLSSHRIAVRTDLSAKKRGEGLVKGVWDLFGRCSSASKKCLVLCACMMGTAALIFCFLLRDVHRFFGSFSAVKL